MAKKPLAQKIAETHEILMSKSEIITETSGRVLSEDEVASSVKQFITIGDGNLVPFSRGFMQELIAEESRARVTQAGTTETTTNAEAPVAKQSLPVRTSLSNHLSTSRTTKTGMTSMGQR